MAVNTGKIQIPEPLPEGISDDWRSVIPVNIPEPTIIELQPSWFRMGYYVYVVSMRYHDRHWFYIGMTGDKVYPTARSPFYRMSGHFQTGSSTQNQVVKGIKKALDIEEGIDKVLQEMDITYYAWLVNEFDRNDEHGHRLKRKCAERIESALIQKIKAAYPGSVFNHGVSSIDFADVSSIAEELLADLKKRMK